MKRITLFLVATFIVASAFTTACEEEDAGANACEEAGRRIAAKYEECNIEVMSGEGGEEGGAECTDEIAMTAECSAGCIEEADCIALGMPEDPTDQAYLDAVAAYSECLMPCL